MLSESVSIALEGSCARHWSTSIQLLFKTQKVELLSELKRRSAQILCLSVSFLNCNGTDPLSFKARNEEPKPSCESQ